MSPHDLSLAFDAPLFPRRLRGRLLELAEGEDMPFAVHLDRPVPLTRAVWLPIAVGTAAILSLLL